MTLTEELKDKEDRKKAEEIKVAAKELVNILTEIFESTEFLGVFQLAQIHGMPYSGKKCDQELENLKKALKDV